MQLSLEELHKKEKSMEIMPIAETIDRAKLRDEEALSTLYNYFRPDIYLHVHCRVNLPYVADDIVSDVFTKFMESIHTFSSNDPRALHRWLVVVADGKIADYYRNSNVRRTDPLDNSRQLSVAREVPLDARNPTHNPISWDDPALIIETAERNTLIHQAVRQLSTDAHKVIVGRIFDGLPVRQVAAMVGKSPEAIRKIQERGLRMLKRTLMTLLSIFVAGLLIGGGWLYFNWEGNSASRNVLDPVRQFVFPSGSTGVTPTPTSITIPSQLPIPTPTPSPTPSPTPVPTPTPTPVPTQQASQPPSLEQSLPVNICVPLVCTR